MIGLVEEVTGPGEGGAAEDLNRRLKNPPEEEEEEEVEEGIPLLLRPSSWMGLN